MSEAYRRYRTFYQDVSTNLDFAATQTSTTLITVRNSKSTIFVQNIIVYISTDAAQSLTFEDSTTGKDVAVVTASPGANTRWEFDFGPRGKPLNEGESLKATFSAAGLAGHLEVQAYEKLTSPIAVASS